MDTVTWLQILDKIDDISFLTISLGQGWQPTIPPPAMIILIAKSRFFNLGVARSLGEKNLWIPTC